MTAQETEAAVGSPTVEERARARGFAVGKRGASLRTRWSRTRAMWFTVAATVLVLGIVIATAPPEDSAPFSTGNSGALGTRAVAEVLRDQGVDVRQIDRLASARINDPENTTLVVVHSTLTEGYQRDSIREYPGDIVYLGTSATAIRDVSGDLSVSSVFRETLSDADCGDTHATAAERIAWTGTGIRVADGADINVCFANADGVGGYASFAEGDRVIRVFGDPFVATNDVLTDNGNAALALRALGQNEHVVWYLPGFADTSTLTWTQPDGSGSSADGGREVTAEQPSGDAGLLPPGVAEAMLAAVLALLIVAWWRGGRFGPLASEKLPVVVKSAEFARGRGRLYRRAGAAGRASAALRAATARRLGARYGIARSGTPAELVAAVGRATGRDRGTIERLLYGPPPENDEDMMVLVQQLDELESEAHQP